MSATTSTRLYRNLLRELSKSSIFPRSARNPIIIANLQAAFLNRTVQDSTQCKDLENAIAFLSADRLYKGLLEKYSPLHNLSEEDRIKATARRVGLDTPEEYKPWNQGPEKRGFAPGRPTFYSGAGDAQPSNSRRNNINVKTHLISEDICANAYAK